MWIGVGLLVVILAVGIWLWLGLGGVFRHMSQLLDQAAAAVTAEDWTTAEACTRQAEALWESYREAAASFTDHEPLEQMDALFDELAIYRRQLSTEYAVVCVHLSRLAEAVEEAVSLKWWSLL